MTKEKIKEGTPSSVLSEGSVVDYIDYKVRKNTEREKIRQSVEHALVLEYKYPRERIGVDVSLIFLILFNIT